MGIRQEVLVISPYHLYIWDPNLLLQIDMYGDLLYESGISRNPLTNALLDTSIYSKCQVYKDDFISHGRSKSQNVDFKPLPPHLLLQLDNAASDNKNHIFLCFYHF